MAEKDSVQEVKEALTHMAPAPEEGGHAAIAGTARRFKHGEGTYYHDYLQLDKILDAQLLKSEQAGRPAHDEMIFIVVHQAYELWFREILYEMGSVISMFSGVVRDDQLSAAVLRLDRVRLIFQLLVQQMSIVETITPLDFLDFRDFLVPASGFQSVQFRLLEIRLGLRTGDRNTYQRSVFHSHYKDEHRDLLIETEKETTLFDVINRWLERTPFLEIKEHGWEWQKEYAAAVARMLDADEEIIRNNPLFAEEQRDAQLKELQSTRASFDTVLRQDKYEELVHRGDRRLSFRATQAAILIHLYRDLPAFQQPFRLLSGLIDLDELIGTWRYRHMMMVNRVIGAKIGTGGSSGSAYLRSTLMEKYRVFRELANLSTYMIPRSALPDLPPEVKRSLEFVWMPNAEDTATAAP